jgi:hypothetical protein
MQKKLPKGKKANKLKSIIDTHVKTWERNELVQTILKFTEAKLPDRFSDKAIDKEHEKFQLLSGEFTSRHDVKVLKRSIRSIISKMSIAHKKQFFQDWYKEIFRLNAWPIPEIIRRKPNIVSVWTIKYIYGRFPKEIVPELQQLNGFGLLGPKAQRHYTFLTSGGIEKLQLFLNQSFEMMKTCTTWKEFTSKYEKEYGYAFQLSLFDTN